MPDLITYPRDLKSRSNNSVQFSIMEVQSGTSGGNATQLNSAAMVSGGAIYGTVEGLKASSGAAATATAVAGPEAGLAVAGLGAVAGAVIGTAGVGLLAAATGGFQITPPTTNAVAYIKLYMPDTMNFSYDLSYEEDELSKYKIPRYGSIATTLFDSLKNLGSDDKTSFGSAGLAALKDILPDDLVPTDALLKGQGYAINPQVQLLFKAVSLRTYTMDFMFSAKNSDESNDIQNIIKIFKRNAAPSIAGSVNGVSNYTNDPNSSFFFIVPNYFQIQFLRNDGSDNKFVNKLKPSVLESVNVDYAPNGFSTFTDGSPTQIRLSLSFKETEIVTRTDIDSGY